MSYCNKKCKYAHVCFNEHKDRACDGFCLNAEANSVIRNLLTAIQNISNVINTFDDLGLSVESDKKSESNSIGNGLYAALTSNINSLHAYLDLQDIDKTTNYIMENIKDYDGHVNAFINNLICSV